jgi:hypothetical protein
MGSWFHPKPTSPAPPAMATFAVAVVNKTTGQMVADANVILSLGPSGYTNQDGYLAFVVKQHTPFSYSVSATGFEDFYSGNDPSQWINLSGNLQVNVEMTPLIPPKPQPIQRSPLVFPKCGSCPSPDSYDKVLPWTPPQTRNYLRANCWGIPVYVNGVPLPLVPGITSSKHPERFLSYLFPLYPTAYQEQWFYENQIRAYTHGYFSWPNARTQAGQAISQFVADCKRLKAALPYLHVKLGAKGMDPQDQTLAQWRTNLDPLMDALTGIADEYSFWEYDAFNLDGQAAVDIHHYFGQRAHAQGASFWCHFNAGKGFWGMGSEQAWYQELKGDVDGLDLQTDPASDIGDTQARIVDHLRDVAPSGLKVRAFEPGTPTLMFDGDHPNEDEADAFGYLVCCTKGAMPVWGTGAGLRMPDGSAM